MSSMIILIEDEIFVILYGRSIDRSIDSVKFILCVYSALARYCHVRSNPVIRFKGVFKANIIGGTYTVTLF